MKGIGSPADVPPPRARWEDEEKEGRIMIKILASFNDKKTLITIDDNGISIDSKYDQLVEIIKKIYNRAVRNYGPSDGFFGGYMAMQLKKYGAEIVEASDTEEEEGEENAVY